jgi:hypothetical protein
MIEGPHPLAGKLIFLPADIQFAAIEWIREPKPADHDRRKQTQQHAGNEHPPTQERRQPPARTSPVTAAETNEANLR